jgi:hypothetical protein
VWIPGGDIKRLLEEQAEVFEKQQRELVEAQQQREHERDRGEPIWRVP